MILQYARLIGIAVVAILGAWLWVTVQGWRDDSRRVADAEARYEALQRQTAETIATMKKQQDAARSASEGYIRELEEIRSRPAVRRIVRVCVESDSVPAAGRAPEGSDAGAQAGGLVPAAARPAASRDIGPDLYGIAVEADRCSAQLRALQGWINATR